MTCGLFDDMEAERGGGVPGHAGPYGEALQHVLHQNCGEVAKDPRLLCEDDVVVRVEEAKEAHIEIINQEPGVRSQESGDKSQELSLRNQEPGARNQTL